MVKTKKSKASGRFGARYGKKVRARIAGVESFQRIKQKCPYCEKRGVKRLSKGIWYCQKCNRKFASDAYHITNKYMKAR